MALLASSVATAQAPAKPAKGGKPSAAPKLVVLLVVDQLGADVLSQMEPRLGPKGIKRILGGTRYTDSTYRQLATYTGPGHALLGTGVYPHKNGIVSNKYFDRSTGKSITTLFDPTHPLLEAPADPEDDSSPQGLLAPTVGDLLKKKNPDSKVVAIALKDRAAVLMAGHEGKAYWLAEATGKMTTSTFFQKELPAWVTEFNAKNPMDAHFGKVWDRSQPAAKYTGPDEAAYEGDYKGLGKTFPHKITGKLDKPGPDFYVAFAATPLATDWELSFVKAAIEAEELGKDATPDLLAVSFTAPDYAGHAYGPHSHEVQDSILGVDRAIGELITHLEKKVGAKNVVFAFSADHGAAPAPEKLAGEGKKDVRRIKKAELKAAVQKALQDKYGPGEWVNALEDPSIYLNTRLAAEKKIAPEELEKTALEAALKVPQIAAGFTRTELIAGTNPERPYFAATRLTFHPDRAGEVLLVPAENSFWGKYGEKAEGSTHGSPHRYDAHVPLAFYGAGIRKQVVKTPVDQADIAPTLAALLGLEGIPNADGKPLPEVKK
ncbi:alkaline phosphatase family protein [Hyalangium gracile]|uniref:alkaline phosphatase family protein n=1 Tax=Hyalangium gracile TaxID=394092 RepID=UPI001CCFF892|nr:alkaline phosphatase family protein [Hyalangium gracile]